MSARHVRRGVIAEKTAHDYSQVYLKRECVYDDVRYHFQRKCDCSIDGGEGMKYLYTALLAGHMKLIAKSYLRCLGRQMPAKKRQGTGQGLLFIVLERHAHPRPLIHLPRELFACLLACLPGYVPSTFSFERITNRRVEH